MAELRLVKAYVQVNTIRGNRYLDDAGKIMNLYDNDFPDKSVGLQGLHMFSKGATLSEMRVSTQQIWLGFTEPDTLQYVVDHAARVTTEVAKILEVTEASRFGLRLEHISAVDDAKAAVRQVAGAVYSDALLADADDVSSLEAMAEFEAGKVGVIVRVRPVRRAEQPDRQNLPEFGIMIDTDIFRRETPLLLTDFRKFARDARDWVASGLKTLAERVLLEEAGE